MAARPPLGVVIERRMHSEDAQASRAHVEWLLGSDRGDLPGQAEGSSASDGGPPAAPALEPLDVAPGREAVGHLQDPEIVNPQQTEKATEDFGHQGSLFPTVREHLA